MQHLYTWQHKHLSLPIRSPRPHFYFVAHLLFTISIPFICVCLNLLVGWVARAVNCNNNDSVADGIWSSTAFDAVVLRKLFLWPLYSQPRPTIASNGRWHLPGGENIGWIKRVQRRICVLYFSYRPHLFFSSRFTNHVRWTERNTPSMSEKKFRLSPWQLFPQEIQLTAEVHICGELPRTLRVSRRLCMAKMRLTMMLIIMNSRILWWMKHLPLTSWICRHNRAHLIKAII